MFLLPLVAVLLPVWLGHRYGRYVQKRSIDVHEGPVGTAVNATLGLLAFMLAFTFSLVGSKFDKRKELMLEEITDIRTTYLYAGLIPEPVRSTARARIIRYVDIRVQLLKNPSQLETAKHRSYLLLDSLWKDAESLGAMDRSSESYSLFMSSVSRVVSLLNQRITLIFHSHLSPVILYVLGFVGFFSMLVLGYQFGITGKMNLTLVFLMSISFAAVMWLIYVLDHPETYIIRPDPAPLLLLHQQLQGK